jgi:hypothetical protein
MEEYKLNKIVISNFPVAKRIKTTLSAVRHTTDKEKGILVVLTSNLLKNCVGIIFQLMGGLN